MSKPRKPIRFVSNVKANSDRLYNAMVKEWLHNDGYGLQDMIAYQRMTPIHVATCCHHERGRLNTLKFDKRFWCPTTAENSLWPHQHIAEARKLGLIAEDGDWHKAPDDAETAKIKNWMKEKGIWKGPL